MDFLGVGEFPCVGQGAVTSLKAVYVMYYYIPMLFEGGHVGTGFFEIISSQALN